MFDRYEEFTLLINQINKDIQKIKLQELKKFGLKGSLMDFIYYLGKNDQLSFKELCKELNCDKAFVSRNLPLLKEKGLVYETTNESNKTVYRLTDAGLEIYRLNNEKTAEICQEVFIDSSKVDEFYENLHQISKRLQKIGEIKND